MISSSLDYENLINYAWNDQPQCTNPRKWDNLLHYLRNTNLQLVQICVTGRHCMCHTFWFLDLCKLHCIDFLTLPSPQSSATNFANKSHLSCNSLWSVTYPQPLDLLHYALSLLLAWLPYLPLQLTELKHLPLWAQYVMHYSHNSEMSSLLKAMKSHLKMLTSISPMSIMFAQVISGLSSNG